MKYANSLIDHVALIESYSAISLITNFITDGIRVSSTRIRLSVMQGLSVPILPILSLSLFLYGLSFPFPPWIGYARLQR